MQVTVRLFAALRERAGARVVELELPEGARAADVWPALELGPEPEGLAYAVNRAYSERSARLAAGDEVALIPPVSGGEGSLEDAVSARLGEQPLDPGAVIAAVSRPGAGAVASFVGTVRERARGRAVEWLEYEAYDEMAVAELTRIGSAALRAHGCLAVAIEHRTGRVEIGEASVAIAVSAAHRAAALDACRDVIEALKRSVPIWKKERYADGEEWICQGS
jgi:molybdopterin synthase catalytic subunit